MPLSKKEKKNYIITIPKTVEKSEMKKGTPLRSFFLPIIQLLNFIAKGAIILTLYSINGFLYDVVKNEKLTHAFY